MYLPASLASVRKVLKLYYSAVTEDKQVKYEYFRRDLKKLDLAFVPQKPMLAQHVEA